MSNNEYVHVYACVFIFTYVHTLLRTMFDRYTQVKKASMFIHGVRYVCKCAFLSSIVVSLGLDSSMDQILIHPHPITYLLKISLTF